MTNPTEPSAGTVALGDDTVVTALRSLVDQGDLKELERLLARRGGLLTVIGRCCESEIDLEDCPESASRLPWVGLLGGAANLLSRPTVARELLQQALPIFKSQGDIVGYYCAWGMLVNAVIAEQYDFSVLDDLLDEIEELLEGHPVPEGLEPLVMGALGTGTFSRRPDHPHAHEWVRRASALLRQLEPEALRLQVARILQIAHFFYGDAAGRAGVLATMQQMANAEDASAQARLAALNVEAFERWCNAEHDASERACNAALALAKAERIWVLDGLLMANIVSNAILRGAQTAARQALDRFAGLVAPRQREDSFFYHFLRGWATRVEGDVAVSVGEMRISLDCATKLGAPPCHILSRMALAASHLLLGETEEAARHLQTTRETMGWSPAVMVFEGLLSASVALEAEDYQGAEEQIATALESARKQGLCSFFGFSPSALSAVCSFALERNIEPAFTQVLIRRNDLAPLREPPAEWPWSLYCRVLGTFEVERQGQPLEFVGKTPKKPLELLKLLAVQGSCSEERLADLLWPEADGAAGAQALATNLHRLRKLLGNAQLVVRHQGMVGLDESRCGSDLRELRLALDRIDAGLEHGADPDELVTLIRAVLRDYSGGLLTEADTQAWILGQRSDLAKRISRRTRRIISRLTVAGEVDRGVDLAGQALEAPLEDKPYFEGIISSHKLQ